MLVDGDQELVHRRLALFLGGEAALSLAAAFLRLLQGPAALRALLPGSPFDPEALVALSAPLRRREAHVDDVLPAAALTALSRVTLHVPPQDARLQDNSSIALEEEASDARGRTGSTEVLPTRNLFGAGAPAMRRRRGYVRLILGLRGLAVLSVAASLAAFD